MVVFKEKSTLHEQNNFFKKNAGAKAAEDSKWQIYALAQTTLSVDFLDPGHPNTNKTQRTLKENTVYSNTRCPPTPNYVMNVYEC